jgi:hypothetical protein
MKGEFLNLTGTALDGLLRVQDYGVVGARHEFSVETCRVENGSPRWAALRKNRAIYSHKGHDGLLWPVWRFPVDLLDLELLAEKHNETVFDSIGVTSRLIYLKPGDRAPLAITEPARGQECTVRTYERPEEMAWEIMHSVTWAKAARRHQRNSINVRGQCLIYFDVLAAYEAGQLRNDQSSTRSQSS